MSSPAVAAEPRAQAAERGAPARDRRLLWLALAGATLLAAALRLPFLDHQSLWFDETYTRAIASEGSLGGVWEAVGDSESTPPLFYLLTWALAGTSEAGLRLVSALAGVASAPVAFFALRRYVGERAGLGSALLVAASPVLVWYALDARAYSLFVLCGLLSLWALGVLLERPTRRRWLAWVVAGVACFWSHYFALFFLAAQVGVLVWRRPAPARVVAAWSGALTAACVPLLPLLASQRDSRADWITGAPLGDRIEDFVRQFAMGPNVPAAPLEAIGLLLALGGIAAGGFLAWRSHSSGAAVLAVIGGVTIGTPLLLAASDIDNHFLMRNVLVAWPCLAGIAALALVRAKAVPLAAFVALAVATAIWIQVDWRYQNADWRGAADRLPQDAAGGSLIVIYPRLQEPVARAYLDAVPAGGRAEEDSVWVIVEPRRTDDRELEPDRSDPVNGIPGFEPQRTIEYRGFRLIEFTSSARPLPVDPSGLSRDSLGEWPVLLAPEPR